MTSPFPGMDPYLESHWADIHHRLVMYACDQIQSRLPGDLRASRGTTRDRNAGQDAVGVLPGRPDRRPSEEIATRTVGSVGRCCGRGGREGRDSGCPTDPTPDPETRVNEGFIQIVEAGSRDRVVTVIEVLSPSNKRRGPGFRDYRRKQRDLMRAKIGLVEIDLLRRGSRVLMISQRAIPATHLTTYQICCRHGHERDVCEVYRAPLRERLPVISVPLRESDPDAVLEIQALVDQCYANGRYDDTDYSADPEPPLDAEDASWADGLLREKGLRPPIVSPETPAAVPGQQA